MLEEPAGPSARIGLVLGGGGASGLAFHAGVLWALHHDLGWDPRTADIIVGTSAGSIVGALLRCEVAPEDLAAWATDSFPTADGHLFRAMMTATDDVVARRAVPRFTVPGWHALNVLRHPSQIPGAVATMLPHGLQDHSPRMATLDRFVDAWPSKPLWIPAVRLGDGRVEWFGRDADRAGTVRPADAVAASCAVPVLARPVRIGDHRYVDGGVKSATHADVLADADLDLVIVLSPMGHRTGRNPLRALVNRQVRREVAALERAGLAVQLISPDGDTVSTMGFDMMDEARTGSVMRNSFLGAMAQLDASTTAVLSGAGAEATPRRRARSGLRTRVPGPLRRAASRPWSQTGARRSSLLQRFQRDQQPGAHSRAR
jgi:NTE family protein